MSLGQASPFNPGYPLCFQSVYIGVHRRLTSFGNLLFPADTAFAAANEGYQVQGFGGGDLGFNARKRVLQFQARAVENLVSLFKSADVRRLVARALQSDQVHSFGLHVVPGVEEKRRNIAVDPRIAADHSKAPDFRVLVHHHSARNECLVLHLHVAGQQSATGDYRIVPDPAIVGDMAGGHDVVAIADFGNRFGGRAAGDGVVLPDFVFVPDPQVTSRAAKALIEWISAENRAGGDFVALAQCGPALDVDIRLQQAAGANGDVALNHAELANPHPWTDSRIRVDAGRGCDGCGWINCHETVW